MSDHFGYVPEPGETVVASDEVACLLVFRGDKPVKIVYPDGRVLPFQSDVRQCTNFE